MMEMANWTIFLYSTDLNSEVTYCFTKPGLSLSLYYKNDRGKNGLRHRKWNRQFYRNTHQAGEPPGFHTEQIFHEKQGSAFECRHQEYFGYKKHGDGSGPKRARHMPPILSSGEGQGSDVWNGFFKKITT